MALSETLLQIKDALLGTKNIKQLIDNLGNVLPLSSLSDTDGNLITKNNGLPIKLANDSVNAYQFSMKIIPTTNLAAGTVYAAIRNADPIKSVYIDWLSISQKFIGTSVSSVSDYELISFGGATSIAGVGALSPSIGKRLGTNPNSLLDVKYLNTGGITVPGAGVATNGIILGHSNQNTVDNNFLLDLRGQPMILGPGQGVLFKSLSAIVAGSVNYITLLYKEV